MARIVEGGLNNGVVAGEEMELNFASWCNVEGVGRVDEATFTHIDGVNTSWR